VCERLPDCEHFHVVFTVPEEFREFFRNNYRCAADILFACASETLRKFLANNAGVQGGWFSVLHTWGRALTWHPHLHVLVSAGGRDLKTGAWRALDKRYLFSVEALSKVFRAMMVRKIEELENKHSEVAWPQDCASLDQRRDWRLKLASRNWNVFSAPTLRNTRAVVRYLARYTSQIAISNRRIREVDPEDKTVTIDWKDYRNGGVQRRMKLAGGEFLRRFASHLVPKGLRRVRYYGLLCGASDRIQQIDAAPEGSINQGAEDQATKRACPNCQCEQWQHLSCRISSNLMSMWLSASGSGTKSFSLVAARAGP
jgi:hypothetical protein